MKLAPSRELALDVQLMAVWRRKPEQRAIVHSDQDSQFGSYRGNAKMKKPADERAFCCPRGQKNQNL